MAWWKEIPIWECEYPWTEAQITESAFRDGTRTRATLSTMPGAAVAKAIQDIHFSLSIFIDSVDDLLDSISTFKGMVDRPSFWERTRRQEFERLQTKIQRGIFSSSMSAMALVDHTRRFAEQHPVDAYDENKDATFSNDPQHRFVHSLRRYVTHVRMTRGNWKITSSREGKSVFFTLSQADLLQWADWSTHARDFISLHPEGVNIESLFDSYSKKVRSFHEWIRSKAWEKHHSELQAYYSANRIYKAVGSRSSWNLLVQQVFVPKGIDPYAYLGRYLGQEELEEVLALPFRSKEQVDRIIAIVDEHGACDSALREHVYRFFAVRP